MSVQLPTAAPDIFVSVAWMALRPWGGCVARNCVLPQLRDQWDYHRLCRGTSVGVARALVRDVQQ